MFITIKEKADRALKNYNFITEEIKNFIFISGWKYIIDKNTPGGEYTYFLAGKEGTCERRFYIRRPKNGWFEIGVTEYFQATPSDVGQPGRELIAESSALSSYVSNWFNDTDIPMRELLAQLREFSGIREARSDFNVYLV